jgi:hypothetical protein
MAPGRFTSLAELLVSYVGRVPVLKANRSLIQEFSTERGRRAKHQEGKTAQIKNNSKGLSIP